MEFIDPHNQEEVLAAIGQECLPLLFESWDEGFYRFCQLRDGNPEAFLDYTNSTLAQMLNAHVVSALEQLVSAWGTGSCVARRTPNKAGVELLIGNHFGIWIKKCGQSGTSANYPTARQRELHKTKKDLFQQGQLIIGDGDTPISPVDDVDRLWLTARYEVDQIWETPIRTDIALEEVAEKGKMQTVWSNTLMPADANVLAKLDNSLAKEIEELRARRAG